MAQVETPVAETTTAAPGPGGLKKKKKGLGRGGRIALTAGILAAIALAVGLALYFLVFKEDEGERQIMTDEVVRGSIQCKVDGSGTTSAKDSVVITPEAGGKVLELFVKEGDKITEGDPLYTMDASKAREALTAAEKEREEAAKTVTNRQKELQAVYDSISKLTITAPHPGKLMETVKLKAGEDVSEGTKLGVLVNDTKLRLTLYYSYAYEGKISAGQSVQISLPAVMDTRPGKVEQVNYVRRVVPEGGVMFEVVLVLDNPGTLTQGMDASAAIPAGDGSIIYPYEGGKLEFYETTDIVAKVRGPVEQANLRDYADVKAGQVLVRLGKRDQDEEIATRELALSAAEEALKAADAKCEEARKGLENHNAVAPISGTVLACNLVPGEEVQSGQAITIADTSVMTIKIAVDERHVQYVKPGMWVDIDQWGNSFGGEVESVSMIAQAENGVATFPAVVKVDNPDGTLLSNMYVNYSFIASQSDDCLTVPVQAVRYVTLAGIGGLPEGVGQGDGEGGAGPDDGNQPDGEGSVDGMGSMDGMDGMSSMGGPGGGPNAKSDDTATIVFVKADEPPANAITEPDPAWECPKGFWAVPVKEGLADNTRAEILEGLNEGDIVFVGYETQQADNWG